MIVQPNLPLVNGEAGNNCATCSDLRIRAFAELIDAIDRNAASHAIKATRALRRLGFSVCLVTPARKGGA